MTREEEIYEAAESFCAKTNPQLLVGDYSFIQGAEWADKHPKSCWISVEDDLPINHKELLSKGSSSTKRVIIIEDGGYHIDCMALSKDGEWNWFYSSNPSHWLPIPKFIKE